MNLNLPTVYFWLLYVISSKYVYNNVIVPQKFGEKGLEQMQIKEAHRYKQNVISLIHSTIWTIVGAFWILQYGMSYHRPGYFYEKIVIINSLIYFVIDTVIKAWTSLHSSYVYVHHLVGTLYCFYMLSNDSISCMAAFALFCAEITHPLMIIKQHYELWNYAKDSTEILLSTWISLTLFSFVRIVPASIILYYYVIIIDVSIGVVLFSAPIFTFSVITVSKMISKLVETIPLVIPNIDKSKNGYYKKIDNLVNDFIRGDGAKQMAFTLVIIFTTFALPVTVSIFLKF